MAGAAAACKTPAMAAAAWDYMVSARVARQLWLSLMPATPLVGLEAQAAQTVARLRHLAEETVGCLGGMEEAQLIIGGEVAAAAWATKMELPCGLGHRTPSWLAEVAAPARAAQVLGRLAGMAG